MSTWLSWELHMVPFMVPGQSLAKKELVQDLEGRSEAAATVTP